MKRAPSPRIALMIPPPKVLCRRISKGSAGKSVGSTAIVSCEPITIAAAEATIPVSGPATEKSNICCLFLGGVLKVVTVLVTPVRTEGTKVGTEDFI
jgi:hypothetical protein